MVLYKNFIKKELQRSMYIKIKLFNDDVVLEKKIKLEDWDEFKLKLKSEYKDFSYVCSYRYN